MVWLLLALVHEMVEPALVMEVQVAHTVSAVVWHAVFVYFPAPQVEHALHDELSFQYWLSQLAHLAAPWLPQLVPVVPTPFWQVQRLRSHLLLVLLSVYPLSHDLQTWSLSLLQAAPVVPCPFEHVHCLSVQLAATEFRSNPLLHDVHVFAL